MGSKKILNKEIGLLFLVLSLMALSYILVPEELLRIFLDPEYLQEVLEPYGLVAAFILIGLLLFNNILWFIPGHGLGVACGLIYGGIWGTLLCFTGTVLSTIVAVLISKKWGRPAVSKIIGQEKFEKYEHFASSKDMYPFVILILIPVVPDDAMVYLAGLTNLDTKRIIVFASLARLPGVITLTVFGQGIANANGQLLSLIGAVIIIASVSSILKRKEIIDYIERRSLVESK